MIVGGVRARQGPLATGAAIHYKSGPKDQQSFARPPLLSMNKPRRRRFFASRKGEYHERITGSRQAGDGPEDTDDFSLQDRADDPHGEVDPLSPNGEEPGSSETLPSGFRLLPPRMRMLARGRFSLGQVGVLLVLGVLAGYLLSSFVNRNANSAARGRVRPEVVGLSPADEDSLDAAYAARSRRDYAKAEQLFSTLVRKHPNWESVQAEIGRTKLYGHDLQGGSDSLKSTASHGWLPADANFLLGALYMVQKAYRDADSSFATAVALDPTRPEYYHLWGESLRAEGRIMEAIPKFRSALLRNQYETAVGLYRLKVWLSELEANHEAQDGTNAEIDAALAQPLPPMEALFASAARDMKAGDFRGAAEQMRRARARTDPAVFHVILNDPTFAQAHARPELAEFFRGASPIPVSQASAAVAPASVSPVKSE